jgi:hypothetical protein
VGNKTVIDELIVALKLDPRDFDKGAKQAAASIVKAKKEVKSATDEMGAGANKVATSFANSGGAISKVFSRGGAIGLAIAATIAAGKIVNDKLYEVAERTRKLGLDSRAYNTSAAGLRNMQNAAELAGGSLEDANAAAGSLVKSLFDLKFNGAVSDQLVQLARLGVQFTDNAGKARDFKDVTLDTAAALEKLQNSGQMSRAEAIQFAQQAGFSGGMAQLVAGGRAGVVSALSKQEARRQVSGEDVGVQTRRVNDFLSLGQGFESNVLVPGSTKESPAAGALSRGLEAGINGAPGIAGAVGDTLTKAVDKASIALGDLTDNAKAVGSSFGRAASAQGSWFRGKYVYGAAFGQAGKKYGVDPSILAGIARTESSYDPNARAEDKSGRITGIGLMGLNPQFFDNAGQDPYADIDTAARHYASLYKKTTGTEQERNIAALRMYNAGESNYRNGTNLGPQNAAYAGKVLSGTPYAMPTPGAQGATSGAARTDITFEQVTINTNAKDGRQVAGDFVDGTKRKLMAAQADAGMQ